MIFSSAVFLYYFLPAFLIVYYLTPKTGRSWTIAVASYVFYGWWRPDFVLLMAFSTVVDFICGNKIATAHADGRPARRWVVASAVVNLGLLGYFKYANFGVDTLNALLRSAGMTPISWTRVVLPVGISFYTFQTMSYTIDVYRGAAKPVQRFRDFMCYVALFPQLVAGPIVRYNTVADQLRRRRHSPARFYQGVLCFQAGLAKKILIADVLAPVADHAFQTPGLGAMDAWLGVLAYAFQIYFDFSGYSDMAIGLGLMIGFRFPVNFNQPYRAVSITDFWRRWHISLSAWLRDYLYIPLGGNRLGVRRTYVNLMLVMLLGGLWHGAAWTFLVWGAWHGAWLALERRLGKRPLYAAAPHLLRAAATFVIVLVGWVFFRAADLAVAGHYIASMFGFGAGDAGLWLRPVHQIGCTVAALVVWLAPTTQAFIARFRVGWAIALQPLFVLALIHLAYQKNVPFLYYQF